MKRLSAEADTCSIVSFNYDPVLEFASVRDERCNIDYGLWKAPPDLNLRAPHVLTTKSLRILKIHGSTNWVQCFDCGNISLKGLNIEAFEVCFFGLYERCSKCRSMNVAPLLVAPLPAKSFNARHQALLDVLGMARNELLEAHRIIVIGYSKPQYDNEVALFLFWATVLDNQQLKEIVVVDPSDGTLRRYGEEFCCLPSRITVRLLRMSLSEFVVSEDFRSLFEPVRV
jgi:NAD-dependent SIR2 family protein deacetylase